MNVLLFGATGMVGQGVLRECLLDADVKRVLAVGRSPTGQQDAKLHEILHSNLADVTPIESQLSGYDACLFCLGVTSAGMNEADYARVTYDLTLAVANVLAKLNPRMTFIYVSGAGTDSTERGRSMWARVKGKTENALLALPFKGAYMFRPGVIQPKNGIKSKTVLYRAAYAVAGPMLSAAKAMFPAQILTTEEVGRAMVKVAKQGAPKKVLEARDISALL